MLQCWADKDPGMPVRESEVITMIQCTLCLIGNTPEFISQTRHVRILEKIDTSWSKYAQEDFSDSKETLSRENFQVTLSDKVEKEAALAKVVAASKHTKEVRERDTQSTRRKDNHVHNQFFQGSPAARYGQELPTIRLREEQRESPPTRAISLNHAEKHSLLVS